MDNAYLTNPGSKWDTPLYLLDGGIAEALQHDTFASFNKKMWKLLVALTSRQESSAAEKKQLKKTLANIVLMINGCHYFLHHKNRLHYTDEWIDIDWVKNPYRCLKKYRSADDARLNHHLAHFKDHFTLLNRREGQNFALAFADLFSVIDLSAWLRLLKGWKCCIESQGSLFEDAGDYAPLETYAQLSKLHEACRLALYWADLSYPPPNRHLVEDYLASEYENGYQSASPLEMISDVFYKRSYADIQASIISLYALSPRQELPFATPPHILRAVLRWILETGWLLLQTDFFPKTWLDADRFDYLHCPVAQKQTAYWRAKSLSFKERKNLQKTLSKLYHGMDIRKQIYRVEERIITCCEAQENVGMEEDDLETRNLLLKTLDVLTLIMLDLHKRRTRSDGVCYPAEVVG
ncbi:hypothetical protein [Sphingobacterium deserti]|uniref:Uncharacterized protein n=1 Tax=Sphingobacterium deserti TaxID=1229276 RepID=A0A0B8T109_9SPHI|nr:hypothetical protein [Sphingobacterium deserti]KGE14246.1 hypothetical protein DI53_2076 [Sphingobacterium deserti]